MLMLRFYFLSTDMLWTSKIKTIVVGHDPQKQIWKKYWFTTTYNVLTDQHLAQLSSQLEVYLTWLDNCVVLCVQNFGQQVLGNDSVSPEQVLQLAADSPVS